MVYIAPSILTVQLAKVKTALEEVKTADFIHVDVMDGRFVSEITPFWNIEKVRLVRDHTKLPLICHLMVEHPRTIIKEYAKVGASWLSFHLEARDNIGETIKECKKYHLKTGIALNPETPVERVFPYINKVDYILVMSVHPGKGGQGYLDEATQKIKKLNNLRIQQRLNFLIEVDGGIKEYNAYIPINAGADIIVSGTGIFNANNKEEVIKNMKDIILLGADHGGFKFKEKLKHFLNKKGLKYKDIGAHKEESTDDYPDFAKKAANGVLNKQGTKGILICRSGEGMSVTANRYKGIYASLCLNKKMAEQAREHGNANILCLGADLNTDKELLEITDVWLKTPFSGDARHVKRLRKIDNLWSNRKRT